MGFTVAPNPDRKEPLVMTDELLAILRKRIDSRYYDQPHVVEIVARAILMSRGIYPQ